MHNDPAIPLVVLILFVTIALSLLMKKLRQPSVIAYLSVGILLGPSGFAVIQNTDLIARLGNIGVIMLLFFVGMEISPRTLMQSWLVSVLGALLKVAVSFAVSSVLGLWFHWPLSKICLIAFIMSLSSTAVIIKLLQDWRELNTRVGQNIVGILLLQDLLVIPMLIVLGYFGKSVFSLHTVLLQTLGGTAVIAVAVFIVLKQNIKLPFLKVVAYDHESQVFSALLLCFGIALITAALELSGALGAFLAGLIVAALKETHWVHQSLLSLRTIFMAFFFVAVGMLVNLHFIRDNFLQIVFVVSSILMLNTFSAALILKALGRSWRESVYGGSLLSQIGEFAFVLVSVGLGIHAIDGRQYQMLLLAIALSLFLSPFWILLIKHCIDLPVFQLHGAEKG